MIAVPSLAERIDDIPELVRHFASRALGAHANIEPPALELLMSHDWPGNVRELKQVVDVAAAFAYKSIDVRAVEQALAHRHSRIASARTDDRVERRELVGALQRMSWDVGRTAAHLGVHRATMYRRMKRHGIEAPRVAPSRATVRPSDATSAAGAAMRS